MRPFVWSSYCTNVSSYLRSIQQSLNNDTLNFPFVIIFTFNFSFNITLLQCSGKVSQLTLSIEFIMRRFLVKLSVLVNYVAKMVKGFCKNGKSCYICSKRLIDFQCCTKNNRHKTSRPIIQRAYNLYLRQHFYTAKSSS